MQNKQNIPGS